MKTCPEILNRGFLLTFKEDGKDRCFGYIMVFAGRGAYEPNFGKMNVSVAEAKTHNAALSKAEIEGLDTCQVGMGGTFYYNKDEKIVYTWHGDVVATGMFVQVKGKAITFIRNANVFRGRLSNGDFFNFKRIS